ncbi:hypothetical protein SRHO_G00253770 [Serrasalmus rhombeus]
MNLSLTNATLCPTDVWLKTPSIICMGTYTVNFLVGFPLNCYIIKLYLTRGRGLDVSVLFALSQSVAELIFSTAAPLPILCYVSDKLCFLNLIGFLVGSCMSARPLFQCCICVERYLAVVHPVTFLKYKPMRYRLTCAVVVWMHAIACGIIYVFYFPNMPHWIFGIMYIVILITDIFCCVSILKALCQPRPGMGQMEGVAMNAAKKKAFQLVSINLLTFLMQITPSATIFGLQPSLCQFTFDVAVSSNFITNIFAGFVQPVFFLHQAGKLTCRRCS